jgi:hypothetical protein
MIGDAEYWRKVRYGYVCTAVNAVILMTLGIWLLEVFSAGSHSHVHDRPGSGSDSIPERGTQGTAEMGSEAAPSLQDASTDGTEPESEVPGFSITDLSGDNR